MSTVPEPREAKSEGVTHETLYECFASLLGLLFLIVLAFVLIFAYRTLPGGPEPSPAASQPPADTSEPLATPGLPEPPTTGPVGAYPAPGETTEAPAPPAVPTSEPVVLPPLPTYPPPGPFREMRLLYTKLDPPGYYSINTQGTDEIRLPDWTSEQVGGLSDGALRVSPNGNEILYSFWDSMSSGASNSMSIWITDSDGSDRRLLVTRTEEWYPADAIWSPDGKQIAYRRAYLAGSYDEGAIVRSFELWGMDANGANQRLVTADPAFWLDSFGGQTPVFRWLNNGYIYFVNHDGQLYAVNPDNGQLFELMNSVDPFDVREYLSPTGQRLVISPELQAQAIAQAGFAPVEVPGEFVDWDSTGTYLTYKIISSAAGASGIWRRDVTTGQDQLLVPGEIAMVHGVSPDNQLVAYQTDEGLFAVDVDTGQIHLIIEDPHDPVTGDWAIRFVVWLPIP